MRAGGCMPTSPELRAGNASLRADGDETLDAVQRAAGVAGQFLPVEADGGMTVRELLQRRDGGPLEARYGRLRDRVLAAGMNGLSLGSEAVKDVAGYDLRRMLMGHAAADWVVFRLAKLPERRARLVAHGGDAFALAEALRADPACPGALVVLEPGLLAIAEDCGEDEAARRLGHIDRCAAAAGAELETIDEARWLSICANLPAIGMRMAGRDARDKLTAQGAPWAYDAGRRLALVGEPARDIFRPARSAPPVNAAPVLAAAGS
jgi:FAD/FMN-containing dehydrogenase